MLEVAGGIIIAVIVLAILKFIVGLTAEVVASSDKPGDALVAIIGVFLVLVLIVVVVIQNKLAGN